LKKLGINQYKHLIKQENPQKTTEAYIHRAC